MKKKKAEFKNFPPKRECNNCEGRGEVKDEYIVGGLFSPSYYTYKKCLDCNGTGKNLWHCLTCGELVILRASCFWCSNINCKEYNHMVALAKKVG